MNIFAVDPTRTTQLRKRFVGAFNRRWRKLKALVVESVVTNDCFGLRVPSWDVYQTTPNAISRQRFRFATDVQKVEGFMSWLDRQIELGIFEVVNGEYWFRPYLLEGYSKGIVWAESNVKKAEAAMIKAGIVPSPVLGMSTIQILRGKQHIDALETLYTRAFRELKGITNAMDSAISQQLADGLLAGESSAKLTRRLTNRVDKIGKHRATLLARTEIIRAHHIATINRYEDLEVENVKVQAEWLATEDNRVCSICASRDGKVYPRGEIKTMIPVHPQCRCTTKAVFDFID